MSNDPSLKTDEQKVSYGFGLQFGNQLMQNNFEGLDLDAVYQGLRNVYSGDGSQLSESALNNAYEAVGNKRKAAAESQAKKLAELGARFLEENAKRDGVTVTESGLQYEILEAGTGAKPGPKATVKTHYHGTFIDGKVFDSSIDRNEPAEFGVNEVVKGWTEALQLMPTGSKWRLALPAELAYGEAGSPPIIPGNSVLVFELHLMDIL
jgi:FKBP-type peptidyl-prolyl cis-trans isomerase FklB